MPIQQRNASVTQSSPTRLGAYARQRPVYGSTCVVIVDLVYLRTDGEVQACGLFVPDNTLQGTYTGCPKSLATSVFWIVYVFTADINAITVVFLLPWVEGTVTHPDHWRMPPRGVADLDCGDRWPTLGQSQT